MSGIRSLRRGPTLIGGAVGTSAPVYVDSDDNILKMVPAGSGTTEVQVVDASSTQILTNKTLTAPVLTAPVVSGAGSLTGSMLTGNIMGDIKVLAANQNFDTDVGGGSTLANVTGMSWSVVAGATYKFKFHGTVTMSTNGGLKMAFKLTTATLTSIALRARQSTDTDNTGAISAAFTTTTDQATWFDQKTVAYTNVLVEGTLVVNAAGTIAVQAAQNTGHADDSLILLGAFAELIRVL